MHSYESNFIVFIVCTHSHTHTNMGVVMLSILEKDTNIYFFHISYSNRAEEKNLLRGPCVLFGQDRLSSGTLVATRDVLAVSGLAVPARKMTLRRGA